jgi:hypothetical protein
MSSKFFGSKLDKTVDKNQGKIKGKNKRKAIKTNSVKKAGRGK